MFKKVWKFKWAILIAVIVIIGGIVAYNNFKPKPTTTRYVTATASKSSIVQSVTATGSMVATKQKNYNFKAAGTLTEVDVKVGDTVQPGQLLGKISDQSLQDTLAASQANLNTSINNFNNRNKSLPNNLDSANLQLTVNNAQNKVNQDIAALDGYILKSTKDGKITSINAAVGDNASAGGAGTGFIVISDDNGTNPKNYNFSSSGKILEIYKNVGDGVKNGENLAKIDDTNAQNTLIADKNALASAKNNYDNRNKGAANALDTANLQQAINTAQAKVNSDTANLSNANVTADMAGVVTAVNGNVGDNVSSSGTTSAASSSSSTSTSSGGSSSNNFVTIVNLDSLQANLTFTESDIIKIKLGQTAQLTLDSLPGRQFIGKVVTIDTAGTTTSNVVSYGVKVAFDKLDPVIKPSMTVSATIVTDTKDDVLAINSSAIKTNNGTKSVQILPADYNPSNVDPKNPVTPQSITVTTGVTNDTLTEITSGLNEGDNVVTSTINTTAASAGSGSLFNLGGNTGGNNRAGGAAGGFGGGNGGNRAGGTPTPGN
jgi:membrane fusion protein, macrolide-specific efflux system